MCNIVIQVASFKSWVDVEGGWREGPASPSLPPLENANFINTCRKVLSKKIIALGPQMYVSVIKADPNE